MEPAGSEPVVDATTFLNLKSELSKKESKFEQLRAKVGTHTVQVSRFNSKPTQNRLPQLQGNLYKKGNRGVADRNLKDERETKGVDIMEESRIALEKKSRMYDEMHANGDEPNNDEILVDFLMKQNDTLGKNQEKVGKKGPLWKGKRSSELVEIVDEFGRTRMVRVDSQMARDYRERLEHESNLEAKDDDDSASSIQETTLNSREKSPIQDEMPEEGLNLHFDASRERTRMMGVGFYQLSGNLDRRMEQMKDLGELREETKNSRQRVELIREKRKQVIKDRKKVLAERALKRKREHLEADVSNFLDTL